MKPHEQRVVDEKEALDTKLDALRDFLNNERYHALPMVDRDLLVEQMHAMSRYSDILAERISRFYR